MRLYAGSPFSITALGQASFEGAPFLEDIYSRVGQIRRSPEGEDEEQVERSAEQILEL